MGTPGPRASPYSPLNHFVSELGELAVSRFAILFNASLIIGGVCFVLFMIGLAATRPGRLRYAYGPIGVIAGIGGAFVGVFPMDYLGAHSIAALTFFVLGLVTVLLASIDFVAIAGPAVPELASRPLAASRSRPSRCSWSSSSAGPAASRTPTTAPPSGR